MGVVVAEASRVGVVGGVGSWSFGCKKHAGMGMERQLGEGDAPSVACSSFASSDEFVVVDVRLESVRPVLLDAESRVVMCGWGIPFCSTSISARILGLLASSSSFAERRSLRASSTGPNTFLFRVCLRFLTDVALALFAILSSSCHRTWWCVVVLWD